MGFPGGASGREPACRCRRQTWVWSLSWEVPLEKGMATHSSILAWRIPWMDEPVELQSVGSQRVRRDLVTKQQQTYYELKFANFESIGGRYKT